MISRRLFWPAIITVVLVGAISAWFLSGRHQPAVPATTTQKIPPLPKASKKASPHSSKVSLFYPITNYQARITNRRHGQRTTLADSAGFACGGQFEGIHVGDDLEVTKTELDREVPVFAISAGRVRQLSAVGGYGGLLITENKINSVTVTVYYGHIDLKSSRFGVGQTFKAGQTLANLGDNCSTETSNERKHLHFAIRRGQSIDVRGYLPNRSELGEWYNPAEFLQSASAAEPAS
jgi:murein DD-endopeptidase MepM/ murein hydrolase activator NlpD